jgi:hypothetical protein
MTYRIEGLKTAAFEAFFSLSDEELLACGARRVVAGSEGAYPCRISLRDAEPGERLILVNHVSNDRPTPYRASHAIYVREHAVPPLPFRDEVPDFLDGRTLSLRGFDRDGMLCAARLAMPGEVHEGIAALLEAPTVAEVHAHSAAHGCFLAKIERD